MRTCEDMVMFMSLYIDKELSSKELEYFENHLRQCEACRKELESLQEIISQVKSLKDSEDIELPEGFHEEVMAKINSDIKFKSKPKSRLKGYALVASMFLIFASITVFNNNNPAENFNTPAEPAEINMQPRTNFMLGDDFGIGVDNEGHAEYSDVELFGGSSEAINRSQVFLALDEDVSHYKILLEVVDVEEALYIINNLQGYTWIRGSGEEFSMMDSLSDTWVRSVGETFSVVYNLLDEAWGNIESDYNSWILLQKQVNIEDYEFVKQTIRSLGTIVAEERIYAEAVRIGETINFNDVEEVVYLSITIVSSD